MPNLWLRTGTRLQSGILDQLAVHFPLRSLSRAMQKSGPQGSTWRCGVADFLGGHVAIRWFRFYVDIRNRDIIYIYINYTLI